MSVINKMLRDLDQRQTPSSRLASDGLRRHTVSLESDVLPRRAAPPRSRWGLWLVLVLVVAAAGGAYGWLRMGSQTFPRSDAQMRLHLKGDDELNLPAATLAAASAMAPVATPVEVAARVETVSVATPVAASLSAAPESTSEPVRPPAPVLASTPLVTAPPVTTPPTPPSPPTKSAVESNASMSVPAKLPPAAPAAAPTALPAKTPAPTPSVKPAASQAVAKSGAGTSGPAPRQQQAARDALAQAQTLWSTGSQDTAVNSLQAAVAVAERQDSAGMLVPLVRELARMELAQDRPAAVLELLTRLEPQLTNQADLWAVRANAAQRLGRHQDSVLAYGVALQSRPTEARWLLGMAVSLAAMGQTSQAATMVEKARESGPISPEVALYLRQQGVPFQDAK